MLVTKQLALAIDSHDVKKTTMDVRGQQQLFGYQHSSNVLFLCSTKNEPHTGLEQVEGE